MIPIPGRKRVFRFFWLQSSNFFAEALLLLGIPLVVLKTTGNPGLAAAFAAGRAVAYFLVGPSAGVLVDRHGGIQVLRVVCIGRFLAALLLIGASTQSEIKGALFFVGLSMIFNGFGVLADTANNTLIARIEYPGLRVELNSRFEALNQLSIIVGPPVAGVIFSKSEAVGIAVAITIISVVALLGAFAGPSLTKYSSEQNLDCRKKLTKEIQEGLSFIFKNKSVRGATVLQATFNFFGAAEILLIIHCKADLEMSSQAIGMIGAAAGIGGFIASSLVPRILNAIPEIQVIQLGSAAAAAATASFSLTSNLINICLLNSIFAIGSISSLIAIRILRQQNTPFSLQGRVTSIARTAALTLAPIGAGVVGWLISQSVTAEELFIICGLGMLASIGIARRLGLTQSIDSHHE